MNAIGQVPFSGATTERTVSPLNRRVSDASQQFESLLLGQWLQEAESSFGSIPGSQDDDPSSAQMKEFAMQHLATEITRRGGIGIAKMVDTALTKSAGENSVTRPGVGSNDANNE